MCSSMQMSHPRNTSGNRSAREEFVCSKTVGIWKRWQTPSPRLRTEVESRDLVPYMRSPEQVLAQSSSIPFPAAKLRVGYRRPPLQDWSDGASQPGPPGL